MSIIVLFFVIGYLRQEIQVLRKTSIDKVLHITVSFLIFNIILIVMLILKYDISIAFKLSVFITFIIDILKELYDRLIKRTEFSWKDMEANFFGILYGMLVSGTIIILIRIWR